MAAAFADALADARLLLSDRRDGYAVIRRVVIPTGLGVTEGPPLPLTRAVVLREEFVGYCRLPSTAVEVATLLTTNAPLGVVFAAVPGDVADRIFTATAAN